MKLRWTRLALVDLHRAQEYIAQDNPVAANALALRVLEAAQGLPDNPLMGRPGQVTGTREWAVTGTPYLLVYRIKDDPRRNPAPLAWPPELAESSFLKHGGADKMRATLSHRRHDPGTPGLVCGMACDLALRNTAKDRNIPRHTWKEASKPFAIPFVERFTAAVR